MMHVAAPAVSPSTLLRARRVCVTHICREASANKSHTDRSEAMRAADPFTCLGENRAAIVDASGDCRRCGRCMGAFVVGTTKPDDWIAAAQCGFFAFDWAHSRDRYQIEALPNRPIRVDEILDEAIGDALARVRIPIRFSHLRWVDWDEAGNLSSGAEL